jgi:hypothetical protein
MIGTTRLVLPPPPARHDAPCQAWQPSPPAPPQEDATLAYHNKEAKDDNNDFVGSIFHD